MAGTITSLGLGSGTLTSSLIDQLKNAETSSRITPITTSITKTQSQKADLTSLILSISSVKTATMDLGDESTYLKRSATSNSSDVTLSVTSGVSPQSASVSVSQLAQNHIMQSKGFASADSTMSLSTESFTMEMNGSTYNISTAPGMTLEQFAQKINDATGGNITASILNTGGDTNPYRLILKAKDTGAKNDITMSGNIANSVFAPDAVVGKANAATAVDATANGDIVINGVSIDGVTLTGGAKANADLIAGKINEKTTDSGVTASVDDNGKITLSSNSTQDIKITTTNSAATKSGLFASDVTDNTSSSTLQGAKDAIFTYNGIAMSRSKNNVDDIITGAIFNLNKVTTSTANLSIIQDTSTIPTLVDDFVSSYNSLNNKINDLTKYDSAANTSGSLQGVSDVSTVSSKLSSMITKQNINGISLIDYGFSLDKNGSLSVDKTILNKKLSDDPTALEKLFRGESTVAKATYTAARTADATATNIGSGAITINGFSIASVATTAGSAETNAQLFADAINNAYESTGVKAYTDGNGKLTLENASGGAITVKTTDAAAAASGLSGSALSSIGMANVTVGLGSTTRKDGVFAEMNTVLGSLISGDNSLLQMLDKSFQNELDSQNTEKENAIAQIDKRYELMANQFAMYDSMISKFQNSFSSLKMQIDSASN